MDRQFPSTVHTMKLFLSVCVIVSCLQGMRTQVVTTADQNQYRNLYRDVRENLFDIIGRTASSSRSLNKLQGLKKLQAVIPDNVKFPCATEGYRSAERPTSVHKLRPGDIDVIGAMGDSLTVGYGVAATNLFQIVSENRGVAFSIGGQGTWRQFFTLPNILKEYNPNLVGYSMGDDLSYQRNSQFNVAEGSAQSVDMPFMAKELVRRMRMDPRVNMEKDWKLVTYMIGGNDFCAEMCYKQNPADIVKNYRKALRESLNYLRDNLPRTIVSVIAGPDLESFLRMQNKPNMCRFAHVFECPCFYGPNFRHKRNQFLPIIRRWFEMENEVVNSPEYDNLKTFAVVYQTFTKNFTLPKTAKGRTDYTWMSADCFHFSQKGNALASKALWNNMLEPVGQKSVNWAHAMELFRCPSKSSPYISTKGNSKIIS